MDPQSGAGHNLQLVVGLLEFTARAVADPDARAKIEDLSRRVRSLALLQEQLYRGQDWRSLDFSAFLAGLVDNLVALDARPIAVSVQAVDRRGTRTLLRGCWWWTTSSSSQTT